MTARAVAAIAALVLCAAAPAAAQPLQRPNTVRLEGYVGPPPERRHEVADLTLRAGDVDLRFQVTNARVMAGRISTTQMFAELRPRRPNLTMRGEPALIQRVAGAAPGTTLRMLGTWRRGSRDFFLSTVEELAPAGATPGRDSGSRTQDAGSGP
jgi:hypothetical protein